MKLIPHSELAKWFTKAHEEVQQNPCLRYGQALWNALASSEHKPLMDEMNGTALDFFHVPDRDKAQVIFIKHYVDFS